MNRNKNYIIIFLILWIKILWVKVFQGMLFYFQGMFFGVSITDFEQVNAGLLFSSASFNNHLSPIRDFHF